MHRIQILEPGTWPSEAGWVTIDDTVMGDVVETFLPSRFRPPLMVGHGLPDGETERSLPVALDIPHLAEGIQLAENVVLDPSLLAYGSPVHLERDSRGGVWAVFDQISNAWLEWARNGNLLSVSPGLYRPTDAGNPSPGKWALKHIAGLGSQPPAQKGMTGLLEGLNFSDRGRGVSVFHRRPNTELRKAIARARDRYLVSL